MRSSLAGRQLTLVVVLITISLTLGLDDSARADEDRWTLRLGLSYVSVGGHDPHVLTVDDTSGAQAQKLETEAGTAPQLGLRYDRGKKWSWGADFRWFTGAQRLQFPSTAADAGGTPVNFEITERTFTSTGPGEVLFFERLGDTDMNAWTLDAYALRRLSSRSSGGLQLLLGLRNADFDTDTHFAAGLDTSGGSRIDASSNYSRMIGPLVGLVADRERGKNRFEVTLALSAVTGDAELSSMLTDFTGIFTPDSEDIVAQRDFRQSKSVTIPMADLNIRWGYAATEWVAFSLGLGFSHWSDVAVPPGVRPTGTLETLYESSITFSDLSAAVEFSF